jgi:hypothetical protein
MDIIVPAFNVNSIVRLGHKVLWEIIDDYGFLKIAA